MERNGGTKMQNLKKFKSIFINNTIYKNAKEIMNHSSDYFSQQELENLLTICNRLSKTPLEHRQFVYKSF